jgi:ribonuclease PH
MMPVAIVYRNQEITYIQLDNKMSVDELKTCLEAVTSACGQIGAQLERGVKAYMISKAMSSNDASS